MKIKSLFAAAALALASLPSMAANIPLGSLSVPGFAFLGNTFTSPGSFQDNYFFSVGSSANAGGLTLEFDNSSSLGIDLSSIQLFGNNGYVSLLDASPSYYSFSGLSAGVNYTLSISGLVTGSLSTSSSRTGSVGYAGLLVLGNARPTTSVPEPGMLALFGVGLIGVALASRRRKAMN